MQVLESTKKLAVIVWEDGKLSWLWAALTALPAIVAFAGQHWPWTATMLNAVQWWWGLIVLAGWIIFALGRRVLRFETPALELELIKDERDGSWWLEVRNVSGKALSDCAVDFERVEATNGKRVFPHSFGLARPGGLSNPFPLRAGQPKQGCFAQMRDGKIILLGVMVDGTLHEIELKEDKYRLLVGAYSEADGTRCAKVFTLSRERGTLSVSQ